ncbi:hypothetical protein K2173_001957 [Erythroxylum novogranatense]|uniref:Uncharacterized protein n=1 Tax=Erythroxylum novogranatense TaxID=1862640 RepID=A0AAV8SQ21_9ROSI|nr:hypothetical protein K2173_001957 [Erythroxylum novogranatense]
MDSAPSGGANPSSSRVVPGTPAPKKPGVSLKAGKGSANELLSPETYENDSSTEEEDEDEGDTALGSPDSSDTDHSESESSAHQVVEQLLTPAPLPQADTKGAPQGAQLNDNPDSSKDDNLLPENVKDGLHLHCMVEELLIDDEF